MGSNSVRAQSGLPPLHESLSSQSELTATCRLHRSSGKSSADRTRVGGLSRHRLMIRRNDSSRVMRQVGLDVIPLAARMMCSSSCRFIFTGHFQSLLFTENAAVQSGRPKPNQESFAKKF